jgi:DNA-binding transcriptional LysR family regulator
MEFRQLKTFRTVADHLNFSRAAEQLHMAQSSVSAQIKLLEEELGLKLFDRIGRRVLITDAGQKLYSYARRIADMTDEIRTQVSGDKNVGGALTIRVPETVATRYMPKVVEHFQRDNPNVSLNFINCTDKQLREELNSGRIDLAFLMTDAVTLKEVNVRMLKTERLILVSGQSHPLSRQKKIELNDLRGRTVLLPKTD